MKTRLDYAKHSPKGVEILVELEKYVHSVGIEHGLIHLVKLRASQINGCAFCIDMHTKEALSDGESAQRLFGLDAWRETDFYTDRERAALAWTEAVTMVRRGHVPDDVYEEALKQFTEKELSDLTFVIIGINAWNRLAIPFRAKAGSYQPDHPAAIKGALKK